MQTNQVSIAGSVSAHIYSWENDSISGESEPQVPPQLAANVFPLFFVFLLNHVSVYTRRSKYKAE